MFKNNKTIKIVFYLLVFLAVVFATASITTEQAANDEVMNAELAKEPIVQVTHNNLTVSVNGISVDKTKGKTDIVSCINLPDNSDWLPYTIINDGLDEIYAEQMILIDYKNPETAESSYRCYHFIFPKAVTGKSVKFTIEKLETTIPENLTEEMCKNAQEKISKEHPTFAFSCELGDHSIGFKIAEKPKDMSDEEAYFLINQALTNTMNGPWEMDVEIPSD